MKYPKITLGILSTIILALASIAITRSLHKEEAIHQSKKSRQQNTLSKRSSFQEADQLLQHQVAKLKRDNTWLKSQLERTKKKHKPTEFFAELNEAMKETQEARIQAEVERSLHKLQERLQLTEDQAAKISTFLTEYHDLRNRAAVKMMRGEFSVGKLAVGESLTEHESLDTLMNSILTEEQSKEYAQLQKEEKLKQIAVTANRETKLLEQIIPGLTDEQQTQIHQSFTALAAEKGYREDFGEQDMAQLIGLENPYEAAKAVMEERLNQKIEALQDILTQEQLEKYKHSAHKQLETMIAMLKPFLDQL